MLVLPNNVGNGGDCDVDRNYVDKALESKVDKITYENKIKELENKDSIIYETIEG